MPAVFVRTIISPTRMSSARKILPLLSPIMKPAIIGRSRPRVASVWPRATVIPNLLDARSIPFMISERIFSFDPGGSRIVHRYQTGFAPAVAMSLALMYTECSPIRLLVPVIGSVVSIRIGSYLTAAISLPIPGPTSSLGFRLPTWE